MAKHKQRKARARRGKHTATAATPVPAPTSISSSTDIGATPVKLSASPTPPRHRQYGQRFGAMLGLYAGLGLVALLIGLPPRLTGAPLPTPSGMAGGARLAALPGPTPTLAPPPALSDDARSVLLAATAALHARRSWHVRQAETTDASSFVQTIAYTAPDRYRVFQPGITEVVAVGDKGWLRNDNRWRESPNAVQVAHTAAETVRRLGQLEATLAPEVLVERLDDAWQAGERLQVYSFTVPSALVDGPPTEVNWWVRARDGLPLRLRRHTRPVGHDSVSELTFVYGLPGIVGPPAAVVLPAATVDPSAGHGILESAPDNPAPLVPPAPAGTPGVTDQPVAP
jgi:hypothetical protein